MVFTQAVQEIRVRFAQMEESREWTEPTWRGSPVVHAQIAVEDVEAEAIRRLRSVKLSEWRTREFVTGQAMPRHIRHYAVQVGFAAEAISRLSPIPPDFDSDIYWPRALDI